MSDAFKAQLARLQASYAASLPQKLGEIEETWARLVAGPWVHEDLVTLRRLVHGITGSGATFGFRELSAAARAVEDRLSALLEAERPARAEERAAIEAGLAALASVVPRSQAPPPPAPAPAAAGAPDPPAAAPAAPPRPAVVFLLEDDPLQARNLAQQVGFFAYEVRAFETVDALVEAARRHAPDAVLLDIVLPEGDLAGVEVPRRLAEAGAPDVPVVFLSSRSDVEARLAAVRVGGRAYLNKPVEAAQVVDVLDRVTHRRREEPFRVLVVEDEPGEASLYARVLEDEGFVTQVASGASNLMAGLVDFRPDIILMDFYLADSTGPELSRMIRQQEAYVGIPIIFVSAERDEDRQLEAIQAGADDFLTKPVRLDHLAASIRARAARSRHLGSFLVRDSLTGALNHTALKDQLQSEVARAQRAGGPVSYVMIDIDHFKQVNDTYGHATGDRVLKSLAHLLQRRLRASDTIGRYGGEEFGIILPGADGPQALRVMDEIRSRFARLRIKANGVAFSVTFSGGIATYPTAGTAARLGDAADAALYEAKRGGRNRLVLSAG